MASRATKAGRKKDGGRRAGSAAGRLARVEQMLNLLLQASLRGRLLPSDRRSIKAYLAEGKKVAVRQEKKAGPRCPVCRSPLADLNIRRCPWCSVLLDPVALKRYAAKRARQR